MAVSPGSRFDRYQILAPIGKGGMGEVYLAQDARLGRKVALKLLPAQFAQDQERLRRFQQEAFAASALNHPNIVTIHEVGEADGQPFIVTEYIEGETLRRRIAARKLTLDQSLEIAIQVTGALAAAHAAGIIHRDIKPDNIMVRPDGYVKVLDFGLAKLTESFATESGAGERGAQSNDNTRLPESVPTTDDLNANHDTASLAPEFDFADAEWEGRDAAVIPLAGTPRGNETTPGLVMGTAQYMSPEQARGQRVDARTDLFSFGIVLYEMIAGRPPFTGERSRDILRAILHDEPTPISRLNPNAPELLEWVTMKALVKDRDERYQSAREMLNDLRSLQRRRGVERATSFNRKTPMPIGVDAAAPRDTQAHGYSTRAIESGPPSFDPPAPMPSRSSTLRLLPDDARRFWRNPAVIAVATAVGMIIAFLVYNRFLARPAGALPFQSPRTIQLRRFTASGKATRAAISPDGKYVVHVFSDQGKQSLLVRQVADSNNVEIVTPAEVTYRGMTFSPDGATVYYVVQQQNNPKQQLYQVPVLGGVPRKLIDDIDSTVSVSPDNQKLVYVRRNRDQVKDELIVADRDGGNQRVLAARQGADFFSVGGAEWSPDGRLIACGAGTNTGGRKMYVAEINAATGAEKPMSEQRWASVGRVSWMKDGKGLIISAVEQNATSAQLWYVPRPKGTAYRVTNDLNDYRDANLTADSRALVTIQSEAHVNVWLMNASTAGDVTQARQITDGIGQYNGVRGLTWTPQNRLVYVSRSTGSQDIWSMDMTGGDQRQHTTPETRADIYPAVSPDGRYIIFVSTRTNNSNLYRLDVVTGDQKQLTFGKSEEFPVISADGRWVIYTATESIKFTLWKVSIDGGTPVQLTRALSQWPAVSPDGRRLACWYRTDANARWQVAIIPLGDTLNTTGALDLQPEQIISLPATADTPIPVRWTPDGRAISYVDTRAGVSNIWQQPLSGGAPQQVTRFATDQIFWFDWSRDGRQLACSRGRVTSDVVLISETRPEANKAGTQMNTDKDG